MPNTLCPDGGNCTCHDTNNLCSACIRLHCKLNKDRKPVVIEPEAPQLGDTPF